MKQLTSLEKRIKRRIAKASKRGRYLIVTRRGRRDRPGRKRKSIKCDSCGGFLPEGNFGLTTCAECLNKAEQKQHMEPKESPLRERDKDQLAFYKMNIPKMSKE